MNSEMEYSGIALYQGKLYMLTGILAEFILDYQRYDPEYKTTGTTEDFREGILNVTKNNIADFLNALNARILMPQEGKSLVESPRDTDELLVFIDFDSQRYVHSYYDLVLENYVPKGWHGTLGDPLHELKRQYSNLGRN